MTHPIDMSGMSEDKRAALELAEAAREHAAYHSFAGGLFMGRTAWDDIAPYPSQSDEDLESGRSFLNQLERVLQQHIDPDTIDRTGEIPDNAIEALARIGAFGIKIPQQYGGLGLSQTNYCRAAVLLGSYCGNTTALLSAHQSIGVPQPLLLFGTEEQKRKYLPRVARGEISAFALTERDAGSDPARMTTRAVPSEDGACFVLTGEKLWCTNGTRAGVIVAVARTPSKGAKAGGHEPLSAFIVEMNAPGVTVTHRCRFMGLRALYNGVVRFDHVRVPRENVLLAEGKGLKVALTTLNTGRLTLPAACIGLAKRSLEITRAWAGERQQWGAPLGRHAAIADKIAHMASTVYAMEAMTYLTAAMVDGHRADIRNEAAMCKMWCTEAAWRIVNDALQIRGGRGYETAESLRARGERPVPVERFLRDSRINLIFEGTSEIMRLFIAREALDPHLHAGGAVLRKDLPASARMAAAGSAAWFYARWYPRLWLPAAAPRMHPHVRAEAVFVERTSRRLARALFAALLRHGPKLEREQLLLGRLADIGTELFAMAATLSRAQREIDGGAPTDTLLPLVDFFCREARLRIGGLFRHAGDNNDATGYRLARRLLDGDFRWLEEGIVALPDRPSVRADAAVQNASVGAT